MTGLAVGAQPPILAQRIRPQLINGIRSADDGRPTRGTEDTATCALHLPSQHPILIDAGFADLEIPIPLVGGRTLRFRFPPR